MNPQRSHSKIQKTGSRIPDRSVSIIDLTEAVSSTVSRLQRGEKSATSRMSCIGVLHSDTSKEIDKYNIESELLYSEYLQAVMTEHILSKKVEEKKNAFVAELDGIIKEVELHEKILLKLKTRERDLKYLIEAQKKLNHEIKEVNSKEDALYNLNKLLSHLYSLVQQWDVLPCKNIILPKTAEEWESLQKNVKDCANISTSIIKLINNNVNEYTTAANGIEEFIAKYSEIQDVQKKFMEALTNLQIVTLKSAMHLKIPNLE